MEKYDKYKKVTVIIPAYNEEAIIEENIRKVIKALEETASRYDWELLLIDDGSKDNTGRIMDGIASSNVNIKAIHHRTNFGRGKALKTGFKEASGDIIIVLDADLSYSTEHIEKMLQKMEQTDADIVQASCYAPGGKVENVPFRRAFMSRVGNILLSHAMGGDITVATCIVRAYKSDVIKSLDLISDDKDLHPEILYKAQMLGLRIEEVPATLRWSDKKLNAAKGQKRKSKFKLKKTTITHLFILFWSRPFILFLIPGIILFILGFIEFIALLYRFIAGIIIYSGSLPFSDSLVVSARDVISKFTPSLILTGILLIIGIQFLGLGFLAMQAQRNFSELYHLVHTSLRKKE